MNCYQPLECPGVGKSGSLETLLFQIQIHDLLAGNGYGAEFLAPYLYPDRLRKISDKTAIN